MSHLKERKEKNCLNCNAQIQGRYCHICGQENLEPKESVWHLVSHFFQDITHFDGKFFGTMKFLIFRPGFLSHEYMIGRRNSYLNPIRMYVFTSAIFFLVFFSFFVPKEEATPSTTSVNHKTLQEISKMDSATFADFTRKINREDNKKDIPMTRDEFSKYVPTGMRTKGLTTGNRHYDSRAQYDSAQAVAKEKDGWFSQLINHKAIDLNKKYNNDQNQILKAFLEALMHSLPQMFFVSLPLFALLLKLLYIRRKQFYYVNHGIFTVHLYIFVFISMLILFGLSKLKETFINSNIIFILQLLVYLGIFFYEYKALRNFYEQRRAKTVFKFLFLNFLLLFVVTLLFIVYSFFSFLKI